MYICSACILEIVILYVAFGVCVLSHSPTCRCSLRSSFVSYCHISTFSFCELLLHKLNIWKCVIVHGFLLFRHTQLNSNTSKSTHFNRIYRKTRRMQAYWSICYKTKMHQLITIAQQMNEMVYDAEQATTWSLYLKCFNCTYYLRCILYSTSF